MQDKKEINKNLTEEQKKVMFQGGTEAPGTGKYLNETADGTYTCANCNNPLFASETKFESKTPGLKGWPGFDNVIPGAVKEIEDNSLGMQRTEIVCAKCGVHLGHIFPDDSAETGTHYCINSVCLGLDKK